jgi:hypothetical protein
MKLLTIVGGILLLPACSGAESPDEGPGNQDAINGNANEDVAGSM